MGAALRWNQKIDCGKSVRLHKFALGEPHWIILWASESNCVYLNSMYSLDWQRCRCGASLFSSGDWRTKPGSQSWIRRFAVVVPSSRRSLRNYFFALIIALIPWLCVHGREVADWDIFKWFCALGGWKLSPALLHTWNCRALLVWM